jgi:hypothetical protein
MRKSIHRQLLSIKRAPRWVSVGICSNMDFGSKSSAQKFYDVMEKWPFAIGSNKSTAPVEGTLTKYLASVDKGTIWQNPRRHALLNYLIGYYTPKVKK